MTDLYSIVGAKHRGLDPYLPGILPGTEVWLVREPSNGFDPNAVQVWIDGKHVGYLPKAQNAALAQFIDQQGEPWSDPGGTADASAPSRAIKATFARSPNSAFPQAKVETHDEDKNQDQG